MQGINSFLQRVMTRYPILDIRDKVGKTTSPADKAAHRLSTEIPANGTADQTLAKEAHAPVGGPPIHDNPHIILVFLRMIGIGREVQKQVTPEQINKMSLADLKEIAKQQPGRQLTPGQLIHVKPEIAQEILKLSQSGDLKISKDSEWILENMVQGEAIADRGGFVWDNPDIQVKNRSQLKPFLDIAVLSDPNIPHVKPEQLTKMDFGKIKDILGDAVFTAKLLKMDAGQLLEVRKGLGDEKFAKIINSLSIEQFDSIEAKSPSITSGLEKHVKSPSDQITNSAQLLKEFDPEKATPLEMRALSSKHFEFITDGTLAILKGQSVLLNTTGPNKFKYLKPEQVKTMPNKVVEFLHRPHNFNFLSSDMQTAVKARMEEVVQNVIVSNKSQDVSNLSLNFDETSSYELTLKEVKAALSPIRSAEIGENRPMQVQIQSTPVSTLRGIEDNERPYQPLAPFITKTSATNSVNTTFGASYSLKEAGDIIVDDCICREYTTVEGKKCFIASASDGSGHLPLNGIPQPNDRRPPERRDGPLKSAVGANIGYVEYCEKRLKSGVTSELAFAEIPMAATENATGNIPYGHTVHTGAVIVEVADGVYRGTGSSAGDMKAILIKADGKVITLSKQPKGNPSQLSNEEDTNLSHYNEFTFDAQKGDSFVTMSDGVHENLELRNHLKSPAEALQELRAANTNPNLNLLEGLSPDDISRIEKMDNLNSVNRTNWKKEGHPLNKLQNAYMNYLLGVELPQMVVRGKAKTYSEAAALYAHQLHADAILYPDAAEGIGTITVTQKIEATLVEGKMKYETVNIPAKDITPIGKPDHISCMEVKLT